MTRRALNILEMLLSLTYILIAAGAFAAAKHVRFGTHFFSKTSADSTSYVLWILVVLPIWVLVVEKTKLNRVQTIMTFNTGIQAMGKAVGYTMTVVLTLFFFFRQAQFSRIFMVVGCVLTFLLSLLALHVFRSFVRSKQGSLKWPLRIAILGANGYETRLARYLESMPLAPVDVACVIPLDLNQTSASKWPILAYERVEDAVDTYHCQEALVALPPSRLSDLQGLLQPLRHLCIPVRVVLDMGEGVFVPERIFSFHGLPLLDVRPYPVDTMSYAVGKRVFDLVFSTASLLFASPVIALICIAIKLTSSGPVIFAQERVSLNGKRFTMLKFRTMYVRDHRTSNTLHTSRTDARITPVGRFLRKTSLDELPQFVNVLKGEMSVVGPRPELTFFVQKFRQQIPAYMSRHNVKCGITGLAQISGCRGSETSISERIEHDLRYIQDWSMLLDLNIILRTVRGGVLSKNAY